MRREQSREDVAPLNLSPQRSIPHAMTKTRRIILLLTQIFMLLAALLAFYHFAVITQHLPELSKVSGLPETMSGSTPETRKLMVAVLETQMNMTIAAKTLDVCRQAILLYGAPLLGGSVILFLVTPSKLSSPSKS